MIINNLNKLMRNLLHQEHSGQMNSVSTMIILQNKRVKL